jgi:predicted DCC family thiol-disulfide oxidoreductase YuxK
MRPDSQLSPETAAAPDEPVLLYDGTCGLCNRAVRLLLRLDRRGALHFATLQGGPGQAWLKAHGLPTADFESMVFVRDWGAVGGPQDTPLLRSDALVAALQACGGAGRMLSWIRIVPRPWRNAAYRLLARFRQRLFGEWEPKPLAKAAWARRFIADS